MQWAHVPVFPSAGRAGLNSSHGRVSVADARLGLALGPMVLFTSFPLQRRWQWQREMALGTRSSTATLSSTKSGTANNVLSDNVPSAKPSCRRFAAAPRHPGGKDRGQRQLNDVHRCFITCCRTSWISR